VREVHPFPPQEGAQFISFDRTGLNRRSARSSQYPKEVQYDQYDGDNDQSVNPTAGLREAWTYVPAEKPEQPQYY
jgi:hypothetical protein